MTTTQTRASSSFPTLSWVLYSGVMLVIVATLFLMRDLSGAPILTQLAAVFTTPLMFYAVGTIITRYLDAPLAAPGVIATGAWLVAVGMFHLYSERYLLPSVLQPYSWLVTSIIAMAIITATGHNVRIWLLLPLVPLTQVNALWSLMHLTHIDLKWWSAMTFGLVLLWWELPIKKERWKVTYKTSAAVLAGFLLFFSWWLPVPARTTMLSTWSAGAVVVFLLGIRHGVARLAPLAIVMLVCASILGLQPQWYPLAWLSIAAVTIVYSERITSRAGVDHQRARELTIALAVLLSGFAAASTKALMFFGVWVNPLIGMVVLTVSGILLGWLGFRRGIPVSAHVGLWLFAGGWSEFYFIGMSHTHSFGLWLAVLATFALLTERMLTSYRQRKAKASQKMFDTMMRWPLADLIIGLSILILLWVAFNIHTVNPLLMSITLLIVMGIWLLAGLVYRLPVLMHLGLWVSPLPYALLLWLTVPFARSLPITGVMWQLLGLGFILLGHSLYKHRPPIVLPFFSAGYVLLGLGLTLTRLDESLFVISFGAVVLIWLLTSIAVMTHRHPTWTAFIARYIPPEKRPYAFENLNHAFLLLGAWFAVIWLNLALSYTHLTFAQQGLALVGTSLAWIALGRLLPRVGQVPGWHVYGAGWFMWLIGLVHVFFSPTAAIIAATLGLAISGEGYFRSRALFWLPVLIIQVAFSVLEIAWMLSLSAADLMLFTMAGIAVLGLIRKDLRQGEIVFFTSTALAVVIWLLNMSVTGSLVMLAIAIAATLRNDDLGTAFYIYIPTTVLTFQFNIDPSTWLLWAAVIHWLLLYGIHLYTEAKRRENQNRKVKLEEIAPTIFFVALIALLWDGVLRIRSAELSSVVVYMTTIGTLLSMGTLVNGIRQWVRVGFVMFGISVVLAALAIFQHPPVLMGLALRNMSIVLMAAAFVLRLLTLWFARTRYPFPYFRSLTWFLRPMRAFGHVVMIAGTVLAVTAATYAEIDTVFALIMIAVATVYAAINYLVSRHVRWLVGVILGCGVLWLFTLIALDASNVNLYVLPVGVMILLAGLRLKGKQRRRAETAGTGVLLYIACVNLYTIVLHGMNLSLLLWGLCTLVGLAVYGYTMRKRIPFGGAAIVIGLGVPLALISINWWFFVLVAGMAMIGLTLLVEVQRERMTALVEFGQTTWQSWH